MKIQLQTLEDYCPVADKVPLYFNPGYVRSHNYENLLAAQIVAPENQKILSLFGLDKSHAKSLSFSPFGSFWSPHGISHENFKRYLDSLESALAGNGIKSIEITHPAEIYSDFISPDWLTSMGYSLDYQDLNQHIALDEHREVHNMQLRKLKKLERDDFLVRKLKTGEFDQLHDFIANSRSFQGLKINIDKNRFLKLINNMPDSYDGWAVSKNGQWAAAVVISIVTDDIVYYYLPATNNDFRSSSPMVLLLDYLAEYYRAKNFKYFDLGVSSIRGKKQAGLYTFKERMGAVCLPKSTLVKYL